MTLYEFAINHTGRVMTVCDDDGYIFQENIEGIDLVNILENCVEKDRNAKVVKVFDDEDAGSMLVRIDYKD